MFVCCCANPICMVNGCQQAAQYRRDYTIQPQSTTLIPATQPTVISADELQRLIREAVREAIGRNGG